MHKFLMAKLRYPFISDVHWALGLASEAGAAFVKFGWEEFAALPDRGYRSD
jgi:hypothetical protein